MKNLLLICLATLFCISCKNSKSKERSSDQPDSVFNYSNNHIKIESIAHDDFNKYSKCDYEKDYNKSNIVDVKNDSLIFKIDSVKTVCFTDTLKDGDSDGIRVNKHIGDVLDYHIVETNFYEWGGWTLINKKTGEKYDFSSDPYLSPNKKYMISFGGSLEYFVQPTFQVWVIKKDKLVKKFELETANPGFEIADIKWITDDKLAVQIGFGNGRLAYGILTIK